MRPKHWLLTIVMALLFLPAAAAENIPNTAVLLHSYLRFSLNKEVLAQAEKLAGTLPHNDMQQIQEAAKNWVDAEMAAVRRNLEKSFGTTARDRFAQFVEEYTAAEKSGELNYLASLVRELKLAQPAATFVDLRKVFLQQWLDKEMAASTQLLSNIQTWIDLRSKKQGENISLTAWLNRNAQGGALALASPPPARPENALAAAEAPAAEFNPSQQPAGNAMDSFSQLRKEKRKNALQDAQTGMQQLAMDRQAAEQEYAAKKMAQAQADAEATRAQAQKLAAAESDALAQRENSWGNRLKRIVGSTVSVGLGAFTGGIGVEAGRRAAEEIFR